MITDLLILSLVVIISLMINQQLLNYIRQQLGVGATKESIKTALISQGWSEQDVTEGFTVIEKPPITSTAIPQTPVTTSPIQPIVPVQSATALNEKVSMSPTVTGSTIWTKGIPRTNKVFMIVSLVLVFGLDLFIIISSPSLVSYWYIMLGVLAVFAVFFCLENFIFRKRFANTKSVLDPWILGIIVVRNLIFLLNFIPLIQILGAMLLAGFFLAIIPAALSGGSNGFGIGTLGGFGVMSLVTPGLLAIYIVLIASRFSVTKQQISSAGLS